LSVLSSPSPVLRTGQITAILQTSMEAGEQMLNELMTGGDSYKISARRKSALPPAGRDGTA
jgi:hypothetical protein